MVWYFYYDDDDFGFKIVADSHEKAFDKALEEYGPQVYDMYYQTM